MYKVSIIIPVCNTEKYLHQCLDSVINQTLKEIEIICVDDGSTDNSAAILDEYAAGDSRVQVIHKENGGLVSARKMGVTMAKGQYIGYVDSDDWIEPDMYKRLYECAIENKAELISSGYFLEGNYTTIHLDTIEEGIYCGRRMKYLRDNTIYRLEKKETGLRASLCCKLFSRDLLMKVQLNISDKLTMAEDKMCLLSYVLECNSVMIIREAYYHYRMNMSSMVHVPNDSYLLCVNEVYQHLIGLYGHPLFTENMRKQAEIYVTELLIKGINNILGFQNQNLLWIDPYWLDKIPAGSQVVLYGGGDLGKKYKTQLLNKKELKYVGCVDFGYKKFENSELLVHSPEVLKGLVYDYIVITIKNPGKAKQVREQLEEFGVDKRKILWYEQPEIFWKYAEADGLLNRTGEEIFETGETDKGYDTRNYRQEDLLL